ncbi:hypothetical protein SAMN05421854_11621 [Amycolatopsis rubida]|uniref:Uncharacterized protein n=1 Tax=Amycolatopsis rubida TaxID=112413 RepID=A0A1I5ZQR0_9PSEU|nr:hypothetical protein SAMN05421854_11621 [Amycolatopsis rubida]
MDQVGDGASEFAVGDRVFGGALSRAVADYVVVDVAGTIAVGGEAHRTPDGVDDRTAAALAIAGCTAAAALAVVNPGPGDTVLIGGSGGGVGVFAVQLARLRASLSSDWAPRFRLVKHGFASTCRPARTSAPPQRAGGARQ